MILIEKFLEKYATASATLQPCHVALSLRYAPFGSYNTEYAVRSCRRSTHILLRYAPQNIAYSETLCAISLRYIAHNARRYTPVMLREASHNRRLCTASLHFYFHKS